MSDIVPFQFNGQDVPAIRDENGEPWWKASDVCEQCGIKNVSRACERLDADEKSVITLSDALHSELKTLIVNEAGLYTLVLSSRKPVAKVFKRWITHEVLPQIRTTGRYDPTPALDHFPELRAIVQLAQSTAEARLLAEQAQADAQEAKTAAAHANENALRALETQSFFTVAEYIFVNKLQAQLPSGGYRACSDHLRLYCLDHRIPFRKTPVGGQHWEEEYAFHGSVYAEVLPGWLIRRSAQATLHTIPARRMED